MSGWKFPVKLLQQLNSTRYGITWLIIAKVQPQWTALIVVPYSRKSTSKTPIFIPENSCHCFPDRKCLLELLCFGGQWIVRSQQLFFSLKVFSKFMFHQVLGSSLQVFVYFSLNSQHHCLHNMRLLNITELSLNFSCTILFDNINCIISWNL